ncbi:Cullin-domain-containing protein [Dothidotthia symphoricarpi CBS 119687]|uniref:Cullin-domain-containing protein n=1 Tax=Dothidotthia symphoricarpi CBS 119687 TaxID=1392245 RepID=A0A6A6A708_9PLEO|nr:Cullin-domain-containing protein [Dothidotthia symphoricarpi CBS 119687]KAF2126421.1 Cullin-domain-containing protein [Dothidotthia symphoricarpi CBS 119687]
MSSQSGALKRKHSEKTIKEHFTNQQKPNSALRDELSPTSKTKRSRLDSDTRPADSTPIKEAARNTPTGTMSTADMYHFPSKRDVVDITSSPDNSPAKPLQRRAAPNMHASSGPKRLLVKNFRPTRKVDPKLFLDQTWAKIDKALDTIFAGDPVDFSLEELYRGVENVCRQNMARDVKERLVEKCRAYMSGTVLGGVEESAGMGDVGVLRAVLKAWGVWNEQVKYLDWIFCYLDRAYLLPRQESLRDISIDLFRSVIFEHAKLNQRIVDGACELVAADRAGGDLDSDMFNRTVTMFHDMQVYTKHFEPRMLELSQEYVVKWADTESAEKSLPEYVRSARALMQREVKRADMFRLPNSTKRDLLTLLEDHLISKKEARLINQDELADLLEDNAIEDLELLYSLLESRKLGARLRPGFMKWIQDEGTVIVFNEKEQENMVVQLLSLKRQLDTMWKTSFHRDAELGHGLRESFETFMNKTKKTSASWGTDNSKTGEMIAKYVDMLLRGGAKAIPAQLSRKTEKPATADVEEEDEDVVFDEDTEVNNQLDQVLDLFRFVHGKAVFEAFYKKDLARRLLMGRSASADAERSMLQRLKTECGAGFTSNLETMFRDIELSREEMASYKTICEERNEKQSVDLNVNILSAAAWPTYPTVPVIIPPQIKTAIDKFEAHYKLKHSGRKLELKHALAHCQVKAKFPKGNKELVVSSFQAIVLLLFNGVKIDEHIDYNYLLQATGLPPQELSRTLQSLACAKLRPLTKHPKSREINPTDTFTLNPSFSTPTFRVKINTVQLKETQAENKETHERVAADRNYETQAAIVRILKSRKRISHAELVAETIKATRTRGVLEVGGIKRNIERLIEKEFLEREEDGLYAYIA